MQEINSFQNLAATLADQQQIIAAETQIHKLLYARYQNYQNYQNYQKLGPFGVAPYARGDGEFIQPGQQLITSVQESQAVKKLYPKLYDFLIHYPQVVELTITDDSFWYMVNLGDRPAIGLSHRLHTKIGTASFIFERAYYIT